MKNLTSLAFFFLAAGILTSVTVLSGFQVLFTISVIYYGFIAFKEKKFKLPVSAYWLLAFTLVALIASLINIELMPKPSKNLGRLKYYLFGVGGIIVFQYWLLDATEKTKKFIINTFFLTVVVGAIYALSVYVMTDTKRARPMTDTMRYGYGSAMFLATLLSALFHKDKLKSWLTPKWGWIAFAIGFVGFFFTYTRGALLGFLVGMPFVLYFYKPKWAKIGTLICALIISTLAGFYFFGGETVQNFRLLSTKSFGSDQIRNSQWTSAVIAIKEKPILGWGLSNFHTQVLRIKAEHDLGAKTYEGHSHNVFLEIASGTGLVGLFFFVGWLVCWAWECFRAGGLVRALVIPFGVVFVVASQFEVTLDANNASMIFTLYSLSAYLAMDSKTLDKVAHV